MTGRETQLQTLCTVLDNCVHLFGLWEEYLPRRPPLYLAPYRTSIPFFSATFIPLILFIFVRLPPRYTLHSLHAQCTIYIYRTCLINDVDFVIPCDLPLWTLDQRLKRFALYMSRGIRTKSYRLSSQDNVWDIKDLVRHMRRLALVALVSSKL